MIVLFSSTMLQGLVDLFYSIKSMAFTCNPFRKVEGYQPINAPFSLPKGEQL